MFEFYEYSLLSKQKIIWGSFSATKIRPTHLRTLYGLEGLFQKKTTKFSCEYCIVYKLLKIKRIFKLLNGILLINCCDRMAKGRTYIDQKGFNFFGDHLRFYLQFKLHHKIRITNPKYRPRKSELWIWILELTKFQGEKHFHLLQLCK